MNDAVSQEILKQLRKANRLGWVAIGILVIFVIFACIHIHFIIAKSNKVSSSSQSTLSWREVRSSMELAEYDKALEITQTLIEKNPNYYYGYCYLSMIYLAKGDFAEAEENQAKAYELFPTEKNEEDLLAIRQVLQSQKAK